MNESLTSPQQEQLRKKYELEERLQYERFEAGCLGCMTIVLIIISIVLIFIIWKKCLPS